MNDIELIKRCDLPAGYQDTGVIKPRIEPNVHPENLAIMLKKINELVERVNLIKAILSDHNFN